jgi:hypothetical protein
MQDPTDEVEVSIPTESKRNNRRMSGVLRRKVAARTLPPLPFQQPHSSPPLEQADDIPAAKKPRFEILISIAEIAATASKTIDTVTNASYNGWVVVASSSSATPEASLAHPEKREPAEEDENPTETTKRMGRWSVEEDAFLIEALKKDEGNWVKIARLVPGRDAAQCHSRWNKSLVRKLEQTEVDAKPTGTRITGTWKLDEDRELMKAVRKHGKDWIAVASNVPGRNNVQCRSRHSWVMRFDPSLSGPTTYAGKRTTDEDANTPNVSKFEAVAAPTAATMSSASSIDTAAVSRTDTESVTAPLTCMEDSRVAPPEQLQKDEGTLAAKRPRFETSPPIAQVEVVDLSTTEAVATVSSIEKFATVAFSHKWTPAGAGKRSETVNTHRNNGVALASMVPGRQLQRSNSVGAIWAKVLDPARMIDRSTSDWTVAEDARLLHLVTMVGMRWVMVAEGMPCRTYMQCRNRWFEYFDHGTDGAIGPWTPQEDTQLSNAVMKQKGIKNCWVEVAAQVPTRSIHQCKQRWIQQLKPARQKRGKWTDDEDVLLSKAVKKHGKNWMIVARGVPGRSNVQCQKRWTASVVHSRQWKTGEWTAEEDAILTTAIKEHGKSWGIVAESVPDRSHAQCRQRFHETQRPF